MILDSAVYKNGRRTAEPDDFAALRDACRSGDAIVWLGLYEPGEDEFDAVALEFGLHELAVEDAVKAHQRPKLERYGDRSSSSCGRRATSTRRRPSSSARWRYSSASEFVITVRHGDAPELGPVRRRLEARPDLLRRGTLAIAYAIVDHVVDGYQPVVAGLENDIDEIEDDVFEGRPNVSRRIYELAREVIEFQRAVGPLEGMLARLMEEPSVEEEDRSYLRDVHDHAIRIHEQAHSFRALLQNILSVNLTLETKALSEASHTQNEQVKRISAWAAILFAPTLVGTNYGMNFEHMPELGWRLGYPFALALMVLIPIALYFAFRRRGWL